MKKTLLLTTLFTGPLIMVGCCESNNVKAEDLMHHRFVLIEANGQAISPDQNAELEFGEHMYISGKMCNHFIAKATLENETIKGSNVSMTNMVCADDHLNKLDTTINKLIQDGASVSLNKEQLILKDENNKLIYQLKDLM
jgi:heat shock protein HslJ